MFAICMLHVDDILSEFREYIQNIMQICRNVCQMLQILHVGQIVLHVIHVRKSKLHVIAMLSAQLILQVGRPNHAIRLHARDVLKRTPQLAVRIHFDL